MAYADFDGKVIRHSWGRFHITLAADCKVGDLLSMTGALADGDSVAAHCVACQDGSSGDTIWAALAVEAAKPSTIGTGGVVTEGAHGGVADDILYLSATAGKLSTTSTLAVKQVCGLCLDTERVLIHPGRSAFVATSAHLDAVAADAGTVAAADAAAAAAATATAIAATIPAAAPAGGTGVAAGGWDTAANRDAAIVTINDLRTWIVEVDADYEALLVDVADIRTKYGNAVTLANESKADYNAAVTLINELKADLNSALAVLEDLGFIKTA